MSWGAFTAAIAGLFTALLPYLEKAVAVLAGMKLEQGRTDKHTLSDVVDANEAVSAHAADSTDERLRRLKSNGNLRD